MEMSPSSDPNSCSATQEITNILRNSKVHDLVSKFPPFFSILSQINLVDILQLYFLKIHC
jgi:hypothetical protein